MTSPANLHGPANDQAGHWPVRSEWLSPVEKLRICRCGWWRLDYGTGQGIESRRWTEPPAPAQTTIGG